MCARRIRKGAKVAQINLEEAKEKIIKIKTLEGMAQSTLNQYNLVFNDLIAFFEKDTRVDDITLNDARDFINWLLHEKSDTSSKFKQVAKKGGKPTSVNNYLQKARAAFNILKREEVLKENVFNEIRNVKFQKHKVETLTVDEIKRIFNSFNKSYYAQFRSYVLLHTLLDTLGRVDETLYLKKRDVDFDKRSVTFQNTKSKKFRLVELTPKTIGQHSSMDALASKFQIREICLDYDHNVNDIDEVEATVEELRIDCNGCGDYIVLNDFPRYAHR